MRPAPTAGRVGSVARSPSRSLQRAGQHSKLRSGTPEPGTHVPLTSPRLPPRKDPFTRWTPGRPRGPCSLARLPTSVVIPNQLFATSDSTPFRPQIRVLVACDSSAPPPPSSPALLPLIPMLLDASYKQTTKGYIAIAIAGRAQTIPLHHSTDGPSPARVPSLSARLSRRERRRRPAAHEHDPSISRATTVLASKAGEPSHLRTSLNVSRRHAARASGFANHCPLDPAITDRKSGKHT